MSKLEAAVELAEKGFRVFPLLANSKIPKFKDWPAKATTDKQKVTSWWTAPVTGDHEDWNIGVCCDDLLVVDIDSKGSIAPEDALTGIEAKHGISPHLVRTPSGGYHIYMKLLSGVKVANTAKKLGQTIDTRSWHGYVVAPGSTIDGVSYKWIVRRDVGEIPASRDALYFAPPALIAECGKPREKLEPDPDIVWDEPSAIAAASAFITHAMPAIQGAGGNDHTYKIAARLRQFGVSSDTALDLMLNWNAKCEPPWQIEELSKLIDNAYAYATAKPHTPGAEFEAFAMPETIHKDEALAAGTYTSSEFARAAEFMEHTDDEIQERQWIVPDLLARGFLSSLIAPSGAGKTQFLIQAMLAITADRPDILHVPKLARSKVWLWNQEDDMEELKRRTAAARDYFKVEWQAIKGNLYVNSGVDKPLLLTARNPKNGRMQETQHVETMIEDMKAKGIGVLIIDPLVEFHEANENDNVEIRIVAATLRRIAAEANAAVIVGHHTKKPDNARSNGFAGNADSGRGASSLQGVTRIMATLYAMSESDAKKLKIKAEDRWRYVRLDGAKSNISASPSGARPEWFERKGHKLRPEGEEIGVLVPVDLRASRVMREADAPPNEIATGLAAPEAVAIADELETMHAAMGEFHTYAPMRDAAAKILGKGTGQNGSLGLFALSHLHEPLGLPAGNGRRIAFKKARYATAPYKVALVSNNNSDHEIDPAAAMVALEKPLGQATNNAAVENSKNSTPHSYMA
ncbi:MAG: bifunctional DNA primase/polymerase [Aestuariivirga sp.]